MAVFAVAVMVSGVSPPFMLSAFRMMKSLPPNNAHAKVLFTMSWQWDFRQPMGGRGLIMGVLTKRFLDLAGKYWRATSRPRLTQPLP